jgi:HSP20 family protein
MRMFGDSFFDEFFRPSIDEEERCMEPLTDIRETEDEIIMTVDLPFVSSKEDIELYVYEQAVEINAKTKRSIRWDRWGAHHRYMEFNHYRKVVELPVKVDPNAVRATFKAGILEIRIRKKKERIRVKLE